MLPCVLRSTAFIDFPSELTWVDIHVPVTRLISLNAEHRRLHSLLLRTGGVYQQKALITASGLPLLLPLENWLSSFNEDTPTSPSPQEGRKNLRVLLTDLYHSVAHGEHQRLKLRMHP